ncbi:MAG: hypothetical protein R6U85_05100 [Salinivirgaceae bacterium]
MRKFNCISIRFFMVLMILTLGADLLPGQNSTLSDIKERVFGHYPSRVSGQRLTVEAVNGGIPFRQYLVNDSLLVSGCSEKLIIAAKKSDIVISQSLTDSLSVDAYLELSSITKNIAERYANRYWKMEYVQRKNSDLLRTYFDVYKARRKFLGGGFIMIDNIDDDYYKTINAEAFITTPNRDVTIIVFVPTDLDVYIYAKSGNVTVYNDSPNNVYQYKSGKDVIMKDP